jgi:hypothetical protein
MVASRSALIFCLFSLNIITQISQKSLKLLVMDIPKSHRGCIHAEVVTHVASSPEAVGLPGYPEVLFVEINVMKSWQSFVALYFTRI